LVSDNTLIIDAEDADIVVAEMLGSQHMEEPGFFLLS
jgi:hypothetical protein